MKINVTQNLVELDGKSIQLAESSCEECGNVTKGKPFTLRLACTRALMAQFTVENKEDRLTGEQNLEQYELALRIYNEDEPDLSAEEIVLLKSLVKDFYAGALVIGQAWKMLAI